MPSTYGSPLRPGQAWAGRADCHQSGVQHQRREARLAGRDLLADRSRRGRTAAGAGRGRRHRRGPPATSPPSPSWRPRRPAAPPRAGRPSSRRRKASVPLGRHHFAVARVSLRAASSSGTLRWWLTRRPGLKCSHPFSTLPARRSMPAFGLRSTGMTTRPSWSRTASPPGASFAASSPIWALRPAISWLTSAADEEALAYGSPRPPEPPCWALTSQLPLSMRHETALLPSG
jgi:hypothetical protein